MCIVLCAMQLEQRKMVSEYKALKEQEEEERRREEMESLQAEADERRTIAAELTAKYRDRVRLSVGHTSE